MTVIKPLTPNLRKEIIDGINAQRIELDTCQNTAYVSIQKISFETVEKLIRGLPDGYPIPLLPGDGCAGGCQEEFQASAV